MRQVSIQKEGGQVSLILGGLISRRRLITLDVRQVSLISVWSYIQKEGGHIRQVSLISRGLTSRKTLFR